jgi:hypothetical protein
MPYAILRTEKLKTFGNIGGSLAHNYRDIETKNADLSLTPNNSHSLPDAESVKNAISERLPEKRRSDSVLCIEYMITASPEWTGWNDERQKEFFDKSVQWLENRHGKNNVVATSIHRDETTPHLIAYVVPLDNDTGRLNAKKFLGGKSTLSKMQSDFADTIKHLGLERGIEGSKAEHTKIKDYYAKVNEPVPKIGKIEIPKPGLMDTSKKYGEKVAESVIQQIKPKYEHMANLSKEVRTAQKDASEARKSLVELQEKTKPYLDATRNLNAIDTQKLNNEMHLISQRLHEEHRRAEIQRKREYDERIRQKEQAFKEEWQKFYDNLTEYQQTHINLLQTTVDRQFKDDPVLHKNKLDEMKHHLMSDKGREKLEKMERDKPKRELRPEFQAIEDKNKNKPKQEKTKSRSSGMSR